MKYAVSIHENLSRLVVIDAPSKEEAEEKAENLCNNGQIDLGGNDFVDRYVEAVRIATKTDIDEKEAF